MTPDEIKRTGLAAIECFNDPARRGEYFETLYEDDVVLHRYTPEPLTPKAAVKAFTRCSSTHSPTAAWTPRPCTSRGTC